MSNFANSQEIIRKAAKIEKAKRKLIDFITYTKSDYEVNWHHALLCNYLDKFISGEMTRLMVFAPPQHGKSEIVSRRLPAYILGTKPNTKIIGCSYSSDLSSSFNREVQRIIESEEYHDIFPLTGLNSKNTRTDSKSNYLRNTDIFEVVNYKGFYKSVGVTGSLTGTPADVAIIDDPVKDRIEANSITYKKRLWEWYTDVLLTRLHNDSKVLLTNTRWAEDDLSGMIQEFEKDKWTVLVLPAIKETNDNLEDPRQIGDALWESKHSKERILEQKERNPFTYYSLYQQSPQPITGGKIKEFWFEIVDKSEVPSRTFDIFIDGAYTENTKNDPTGIDIFLFDSKNKLLYWIFSFDKYLEMPEFLKYITELKTLFNITVKNKIYFEPKASGKSMKQLLKDRGYSAIELKTKLISEGKEARVDATSPIMETERIKIVKGIWNEQVLNQLKTFPSKHDEHVDNLCYAIDNYFYNVKKPLISGW